MREKLIQYVELLFAGSTVHDEVRQEILQNTLDRYDDLVAQGKQAEAAYQLAISGIGDINEILGTMPQSPAPAEKEAPKKWSRKKITGIATALYICCAVPVLLFQNELGVCLMFVFIAAATAMLIWGGEDKVVRMSREEFESLKNLDPAQLDKLSARGELTKSINHLISVIILVIYLALSFATGAWFITWVIFPIGGAVKGLVRAVMDLKEAGKHET